MSNVAKKVVTTINLICVMAGVFLLIVGVLWLGDASFQSSWTGLTDNALAKHIPNMKAVAVAVVIIGVVMLLFGIAGSLLAFFPNKLSEQACTLLSIYILVMGFLLAAELIVGTVAFMFRSKIPHALHKSLTEGVRDLITGSPDTPFNNFLLPFQYEANCCGSNNYTDYFFNSSYQRKPSPSAPICKAVPITCCERNNSTTNWTNLKPADLKDYSSCCDLNNNGTTGRYHEGCFGHVNAILLNYSMAIDIGLIVFACLQLSIELLAVYICFSQTCGKGANDYESI